MTGPLLPSPDAPSKHMQDQGEVVSSVETTYPTDLDVGPGLVSLIEAPNPGSLVPVIQGALYTDYRFVVGFVSAIGAKSNTVKNGIVGALRQMYHANVDAANAYERAKAGWRSDEYRMDLKELPQWLDNMARNQDLIPEENPHG